MSEESTACAAPSLIVARTLTKGDPISVPFCIAHLNPLSQALMYSDGIVPP
jgi:hypothetical protein